MADQLERLREALAGRYDIREEVGEGGMATVYLARELRHQRQVAVKVLKPELAAMIGARRFVAEIQVTAKLQHPHILPLFDSGEADSFLYYVMPFVEGESLRARLDREKQLPIGESIRIATEVAHALEYAHRHDVVHRDIKPENIMLQDDLALVADFGIALAVQTAGGQRLTETGLSIGTPHYMSPEQATGRREIDGRSDVYSLAVVLFEMLSGEPPYTGATAQAIIAKVITDDPRPITELRRTVPPAVEGILAKALAKIPADRQSGAHVFAQELTSILDTGDDLAVHKRSLPGKRRRFPAPAWVGVTGLVAFMAGVTVARHFAPDAVSTVPVTRFTIDVPAETPIAPSDLSPIALSPDGRRLVYVAQTERRTQLFLREAREIDASPLPGTEGAMGPFFSPDGEWVGFFAEGKLRKVPVGGGAPVNLADATLARGAFWGTDNTILFTSAPGTGLWRVSANGGTPEIFTHLDLTGVERTHRLPDVTPDGRFGLFTTRTGRHSTFDAATISVLSMETSQHHVVWEGGSAAKWIPTGHLVFARAGSLNAIPVDIRSGTVTGQPVTLVTGVMTDPSTGAAHYSLSANGTLAYVAGDEWVARRQMRLIDPDGTSRILSVDSRPFRSPRFSPDGRRIAVVTEAANDDIWLYDVRQGTSSRFTFESGSNIAPVWSPDGRLIAFSSNRQGRYNLYLKAADGTGEVEQVAPSEHIQFGSSWHPDGAHLAFSESNPDTGGDIWIASTGSAAGLVVYLKTPFNEYGAAFSTDGRWIAYVSDESGRDEIYAQRYPEGGRKRQVTVEGGVHPVWSRDGRALLYRNGGDVMTVDVITDPDFRSGNPRRLMALPFDEGTVAIVRNHDFAPDGSGLLVLHAEDSRPPTKIHVVINWFAEVRERLGG